MSSDLNRTMLIGRLVRDPELRHTQGGSSVSSFSIASNRTYTTNGEKKEFTSFFNCVAWAKLGEVIVEHCKKGHRIGIEGRLQQRSWDDKDGNKKSTVEIVVENFQFLQPKSEVQESLGDEVPSAPASTDNNPFSDDEIPF